MRRRVSYGLRDWTPCELDRLWEKVDVRGLDECWPWLASFGRDYPQFSFRREVVKPHVVIFELIRGPVASGLELDHTCFNYGCVNPWCLEPVTHLENVRRGRRWRGGVIERPSLVVH